MVFIFECLEQRSSIIILFLNLVTVFFRKQIRLVQVFLLFLFPAWKCTPHSPNAPANPSEQTHVVLVRLFYINNIIYCTFNLCKYIIQPHRTQVCVYFYHICVEKIYTRTILSSYPKIPFLDLIKYNISSSAYMVAASNCWMVR